MTKPENVPNVIAAIAAHPFLQGLSGPQLDALAACAMPVRFEAGQLIFREGDPANRFYLIKSGKIALESGATIIQLIGASDVLGWSWLFPPYLWHFGARALEPVEAVFFYGTRLREACEEDRDLGYELMKRTAGVLLERLMAARRALAASS